jgi:hypothetical protein
MSDIPDIIKKQIDDFFDGLEIVGDDDYINFFHKNGKPLFTIFKDTMLNYEVNFFRDTGSIVFYGTQYSPSIKDYIYEKIYNVLVGDGMEEDEIIELNVFSPTKDKIYREMFYELLNEE